MNILIVGERYSQNLGDPIICETVSNIIKDQFGKSVDISLFDLSGKTGYDEFFQFVNTETLITLGKMMCRIPLFFKNTSPNIDYRAITVRHIRSLSLFDKILRENNIDLILFAGGAMFMDFFADLIYYIIKEASFRKIPVIFHACGISKLSKRSGRLLKKAFLSRNIRSISIRDKEDRFFNIFGKKIIVEKTNDTALCCSKYYVANSERIADIGIGIIDLPQYKEHQKQIIEALLNSQFSWKIFSNGSPYDQTFAEQILTELNIAPNHFSDYLCDRPLTPDELVKTITGFKKIISFRMHSQIIASSFSVDSYAVIWDEKVKDFFESIGFPQRCFYPSEIVEAIPSILEEQESSVLKSKILVCAEKSKNNLVNRISDVLKEK